GVSGNLSPGDTVVSERVIDGNTVSKNHVLSTADLEQFIAQRNPSQPSAPAHALSSAQQSLLLNDYQLRNVTILDSSGEGRISAGDLLTGNRDPDPLKFFDDTAVQFPLTQDMVNKLLTV
ncbi:MAG: hypothetical protein R3E89_11650, partial [Thiolinea sp.]